MSLSVAGAVLTVTSYLLLTYTAIIFSTLGSVNPHYPEQSWIRSFIFPLLMPTVNTNPLKYCWTQNTICKDFLSLHHAKKDKIGGTETDAKNS